MSGRPEPTYRLLAHPAMLHSTWTLSVPTASLSPAGAGLPEQAKGVYSLAVLIGSKCMCRVVATRRPIRQRWCLQRSLLPCGLQLPGGCNRLQHSSMLCARCHCIRLLCACQLSVDSIGCSQQRGIDMWTTFRMWHCQAMSTALPVSSGQVGVPSSTLCMSHAPVCSHHEHPDPVPGSTSILIVTRN